MTAPDRSFVSRGGRKLAHALHRFTNAGLDVRGLVCADLGCHVGGFTDCLLQHGAARVFAVDTAANILHAKLRNHPNVVVCERCNALHFQLNETVDLVTIDAGWTIQSRILPVARTLIKDNGRAITLVKPQYESDQAAKHAGVMPENSARKIAQEILSQVEKWGWSLLDACDSPISGSSGNLEILALLAPGQDRRDERRTG